MYAQREYIMKKFDEVDVVDADILIGPEDGMYTRAHTTMIMLLNLFMLPPHFCGYNAHIRCHVLCSLRSCPSVHLLCIYIYVLYVSF